MREEPLDCFPALLVKQGYDGKTEREGGRERGKRKLLLSIYAGP